MKQKTHADCPRRMTVAALMICFCIPIISNAQIVHLPAPTMRGEEIKLSLRAPTLPALLLVTSPQESSDQRPKPSSITPASEGSAPVVPGQLGDSAAEKQSLFPALPETTSSDTKAGSAGQAGEERGFGWDNAIRQALFFTGIMHGFRFATEPGTREELDGPFFKDYFRSVRNLRGWKDGDPFLVNYIGHPMEGAVSGYIQIQNDPKGIRQEFGIRKSYWKSRFKAMGWAALLSTQFELGLISEASLGNVGLKPSEKSRHPMGYVDLVITPTFGTGWLVGEDMLDRFVVQRIENKFSNRLARVLVRSFLNPSRSMANILRFKYPWRRDNRPL